MKTKLFLLGGVLVLACGCNSTGGMSNTGAGAIGGGAIGAGLGALVGSATHHAGAGALIGGGLGAGLGALAGHSEDQAERKQKDAIDQAKASYAAQHPKMTTVDVINMVHNHVEDGLIIQQIRSTGSNFTLTSDDIITLRQQGVSEVVISEMQRQHTILYQAPARPIVIQEAPPVAIGVEYVRPAPYYYRRW